MSEPRRKWWRRLLLVIAVGPIAEAISTSGWLLLKRPQSEEIFAASNALRFALWGLTVGILRRSLARAVIGLHIGAALGGCVFLLSKFLQPFLTVHHWNVSYIMMGMCLGSVLSLGRKHPFSFAVFGALAGLTAFSLEVLISEFGKNLEIIPDDIPSFYLIPFFSEPPALFLFFWLIADVLPRREAARERAEPPFDPPPPSA